MRPPTKRTVQTHIWTFESQYKPCAETPVHPAPAKSALRATTFAFTPESSICLFGFFTNHVLAPQRVLQGIHKSC